MFKKKPTERPGFIILELAVALVVIGMLTFLTARVVMDYTKTRDHYAGREAATWAAEAQVQRLLAGAALDSRPPVGALPEEVTLTQDVTAGEGAWTDFDLVTVTATVNRHHAKPIHAVVRCYLVREVTP